MNQLSKQKRNPWYKGYRIGSTLMGETFVEKGGVHISWANSVQDAKRLIDKLTKPAKTKKNLVLEKGYSPTSRAYIARIIRRELRSGTPFNQAVAMAHDMARKKRYKVPAKQNPRLWETLLLKSTPRRRGTKKTVRANRCKFKKTNRPRRGVVIGALVESITYKGGKGKNKQSRWVHKFETPVQMVGMKDGSVKLESKDGLKLWDYF